MNCDQFKSWLPDYWAQGLTESEKSELLAHLDDCADCRLEHNSLAEIWSRLELLPADHPGVGLRARFYTMLEAYMSGQEEVRQWDRWGLRGWLLSMTAPRLAFHGVMAILLLLTGAGVSHFLNTSREATAEIAMLRREVHSMQQMFTLALLQQQSASERIRGLSWSRRVPQLDAEVLSALLQVLDYDANVNVRLAAVDALYRYAGAPIVREGLVQALARQDSPLVQIALIDLLVEIREEKSVDAFKRMLSENNIHESVRLRAEWALRQLG